MSHVTTTPTLIMALHFTSEAPEDQFYTDFGNLNKFQEDVRVVKPLSMSSSTYPSTHLCSLSRNWWCLFLSFWHLLNRYYTEENMNRHAWSWVVFYLLQSSYFISQLEDFAGQFSLGATALKNLVKTVLVISPPKVKNNEHGIMSV